MDTSETNILSFYDELRQLFNIPDDDKIILLGDLNARVGRDSHWKHVVLSKKTNTKVYGNTHALDTGI